MLLVVPTQWCRWRYRNLPPTVGMRNPTFEKGKEMQFTMLATPIDCVITRSGEMVTWSMYSSPIFSIKFWPDEGQQKLAAEIARSICSRLLILLNKKIAWKELEPTYHRVGCLLACACLNVGFIRSNPDVRTVKNHLSRSGESLTEPAGSPSRVNDKVVCECRSLLEIPNQLPKAAITYNSWVGCPHRQKQRR